LIFDLELEPRLIRPSRYQIHTQPNLAITFLEFQLDRSILKLIELEPWGPNKQTRQGYINMINPLRKKTLNVTWRQRTKNTGAKGDSPHILIK